MGDKEAQDVYQSDVEDDNPQTALQPQGQRTMQGARLQKQAQNDAQLQTNQPQYRTYDDMGVRRTPVRESRIKERPNYKDANDSSIRIKIELDLEVEVDLYARVKGDVTIGLM